MSSKIDIEDNFFNLCNFKKYNNIYHNLNSWNIDIDNWNNKAGQIEVDIIVSYCEMEIEIKEKTNDINFFNKNTLRLIIKINRDKNKYNYIFNDRIKCTFSENVKYILLDTLFIYPHNWYYLYNREYLCNKIINSIDYINDFIQAYKTVFNSIIPFIFIKNISENIEEYIFEIIIKEYLDIFYVSTDNDNATIFLNLIVDSKYIKENNIKYKKITLSIPRQVKDKKNKFKFVTSKW